MKYVIVLAVDGEQYALEKTDDADRANTIMALCQRNMPRLFPTAIVEISYDRSFNGVVENHPDKHEIMGRLLSLEIDKVRVIEHAD